jgi:hypothetical protein
MTDIAWKIVGVIVATLFMGIVVGIPIGMNIILQRWKKHK